MFDRWASYDGAFAMMVGLALLATSAILIVRETPEIVDAREAERTLLGRRL